MADQPLSFAAQAVHYFQREHEDVCRVPIEGPCAWRGEDLKRSGGWSSRFSEAEVAEFEAALAHVRHRGVAMREMGAGDFPLSSLGGRIAEWRREILEGRGFVLLRGLPVERWGEENSSVVFWGIGLHLGRPGEQNPQGDLLGHVVDLGEEASQPWVRRYRTAGDIAYHCDLADAVGLFCLGAARRGGASRIVSSVAVYNELLRRRPDLVDRLFEPFYLDTRDEAGGGPAYLRVPACRHSRGRLKTFYHSDYFRSVTRHREVPPFTAAERELMDLYEEIASSPRLRLDMQFEPGDIQLISNHTVLHARTAYEDDADPRRRRHLLRLWLSLDPGPCAQEAAAGELCAGSAVGPPGPSG